MSTDPALNDRRPRALTSDVRLLFNDVECEFADEGADLAAAASRLGFAEGGEEGEQQETRPGVIKVKEMLNARLKIEITDGCVHTGRATF